MRQTILVFIIVAFSVFLFLKDLKLQSATYDEGFYYLENTEYLIKNTSWDKPNINLHPPLMSYLHGWPFLFINPNPSQKLFIERVSIIPVYILFAIFLFFITKRNFGTKSGLVALILYCFSVEILAHSRLVTADFVLAVTIFIATASFSYLIQKQTLIWVVISGLTLGLALISKYTALMLIPIYLLVFKITPLRMIGLLTIALLIVHASYFFKETGKTPQTYKTPIINRVYQDWRLKHLLKNIPGSYLQGLDYQLAISQTTRWSFFLGEVNKNGVWYFYLISFLLKTQIPLLILMLFYIYHTLKTKKLSTIEAVFIITIIFYFLYLSFFSNLNLGLRYILPIYPLLFFLVSKPDFSHSKVAIVLLLFYVFETIRISPYYLSYANQFIGGSKNAYKYFADSNLDWGQNYIYLDDYLQKHPETIVNPRQPIIGRIIVGVNDYNLTYYQDYIWLRKLNKKPIEQVGSTWLIFDIKQEDINMR